MQQFVLTFSINRFQNTKRCQFGQLAFANSNIAHYMPMLLHMMVNGGRTTNEMWNANVNIPSTHKYCISFTCWYRYHLYNHLSFTKGSKNEENIGIVEPNDVGKKGIWLSTSQLFANTTNTRWCGVLLMIFNTLSDTILTWLLMMMMTQNTRKLNGKGSHSCEQKWWHSQFISFSPKWHISAYETLCWHLFTASICTYPYTEWRMMEFIMYEEDSMFGV